MEFEFRKDVTGQLQAVFSMGHEAMAAWLQEEVGQRRSILTSLNQVLDQLGCGERWDFTLEGAEYTLHLNREEAEVIDSRIDFDADSDDPDNGEELGWYDQEARCSCGLSDFRTMLREWQRFISSTTP